MKTKIIYLMLAFVLTANLIYAADSKTEKIKKIIEITKMNRSMNEMLDAAFENAKKMYPTVSQKFWTDLKNDVLKNDVKDLNNEYIKIYSRYYSESELDELLKFFNSSIGKKMLDAQPKITGDAMKTSMEWGQKVGKKIQDKINTQTGKK